MTITVPITALGIVRAAEILQTTRNDLARRHDRSGQVVSVPVDRGNPVASGGLSGQSRVVDLQV